MQDVFGLDIPNNQNADKQINSKYRVNSEWSVIYPILSYIANPYWWNNIFSRVLHIVLLHECQPAFMQ